MLSKDEIKTIVLVICFLLLAASIAHAFNSIVDEPAESRKQAPPEEIIFTSKYWDDHLWIIYEHGSKAGISHHLDCTTCEFDKKLEELPDAN